MSLSETVQMEYCSVFFDRHEESEIAGSLGLLTKERARNGLHIASEVSRETGFTHLAYYVY